MTKKEDVIIPNSITMTEKTTPLFSRKASNEDAWINKKNLAVNSSVATPTRHTSSRNSPDVLNTDKKLKDFVDL